MLIQDWQLKEQDDTIDVSAEVDGLRLSYRLPRSSRVSRLGDAFVAHALFPAMARGETIEVDPELPVSPKFLANCEVLQEIFHTWNPVLKRISVRASAAPAPPLDEGTMCFFSGGVDSTFTFLKHQDEIDHVVYIRDFNFPDAGRSDAVATERNRRFVESFGKTFIPIETDSRSFGHRYGLSRFLTECSELGAIALLLGFRRTLVAASLTYDNLVACGGHPLTEPLYSNEGMELVHDGAEATRVDKLKRIVRCDAALANLLVCADDPNENCGRCGKCLRTMIPLTLLGIDQAPFPALPPAMAIRKLRAGAGGEEIPFFRENYALALEVGGAEHRELRGALRVRVRRAAVRRALADLDEALLGGTLRRLLGLDKVGPGIGVTPERW